MQTGARGTPGTGRLIGMNGLRGVAALCISFGLPLLTWRLPLGHGLRACCNGARSHLLALSRTACFSSNEPVVRWLSAHGGTFTGVRG